jgi:hypothetical protein
MSSSLPHFVYSFLHYFSWLFYYLFFIARVCTLYSRTNFLLLSVLCLQLPWVTEVHFRLLGASKDTSKTILDATQDFSLFQLFRPIQPSWSCSECWFASSWSQRFFWDFGRPSSPNIDEVIGLQSYTYFHPFRAPIPALLWVPHYLHVSHSRLFTPHVFFQLPSSFTPHVFLRSRIPNYQCLTFLISRYVIDHYRYSDQKWLHT